MLTRTSQQPPVPAFGLAQSTPSRGAGARLGVSRGNWVMGQDTGRGRKWGRWFIQQGRIMQKLTAFKSHPLREARTAGGWVSSSGRTGATRHSSG